LQAEYPRVFKHDMNEIDEKATYLADWTDSIMASCSIKNFVNWVKTRSMRRDKAIETMKEFPQEFELEELIERLVFVEKVEKGLHQVEQGKTVTHEKVKEITKKW